MKEYSEYRLAEQIRKSVASKLARRVEVTDEMIEAARKFNQARTDYLNAVNKAADSLL